MPWFVIIIAGLFETVWAIGLKYTEGFTRLWPSIITITAMAVSFLLLSKGLKTLPVGSAYAVWTGIGAAGTAVVGMVMLGEPYSAIRVLSILLIIIGIVGLKIS